MAAGSQFFCITEEGGMVVDLLLSPIFSRHSCLESRVRELVTSYAH